jgi:hypothetical protein
MQALRSSYEFSKRSVGLCYLSTEGLVIGLEAPRTKPLQSWLSVAIDLISAIRSW